MVQNNRHQTLSSTVIVASLVYMCFGPASAAGQDLLARRNTAGLLPTDCRRFVETNPPKDASPTSDALKTLLACYKTAKRELSARAVPTIVSATTADGAPAKVADTLVAANAANTATNQWLLRQHINLKALDRWVGRYADTSRRANEWPPELSELLTSSEESHTTLEAMLAQRGLRELFSATLVTGAVVGNGRPVDEGSGGEQTAAALAHVVWESKHFGDDRFERFDFALGGRFGFVPALSLVEPVDDSAPAESEESPQAVYQEAFLWDLGARANLRANGQKSAEVSLGVRIGQTILGTQSVLLDRGQSSVLSVPIANGATKAELFWEAALAYNLFNNPMEVVHGEGSTVAPAFSASIAWRHDSRFRGEGALASFDAPDERLVFRFMIDALKVIDRREVAEKPRTFTFGFGVEHEAPLRRGGTTVPSGTKLIFRGDIDLLRALRGQ